MTTKTRLTADDLERMPDDDSAIVQYLAAGCQVVMIVNREAREIDVFKADGSEYTLQAADTLEIPELLPGFSVKVGELFE